MYRQHFGLRCAPLSKEHTELWDDGALAQFNERFQWLLHSPGIGLLTGEPGVGKTAALRHATLALNPHRYQVIYLAETEFGRIDLYRSLARALGLEPAWRRAELWRDLKLRIQARVQLKPVIERERFAQLIQHALKSAGCHHTLLADSGLELLRQASRGLPRPAGRILRTAMQMAVPKGLNHLPDELLQQAIGELK
jgi:type II secretory pathway predicted ATPase ExeA